MGASRRFSTLPVILVLLAAGASFSVSTTHAVPPPEGLAASDGVVPESTNCSPARRDDERCLPSGPRGNPQPGGPIMPPGPPPLTPPVPPATPPVVPIPLAPGRQAGPPDDTPGPPTFVGTAKATLHIKDEIQDVTYTSNEVLLAFTKSGAQDTPGNVKYLLVPVPLNAIVPEENSPNLTMTWTAKGKVDDCIVEGKAFVRFPYEQIPNSPNVRLMDPSRDPTPPAWGQLNLIGPDGGDFHSVTVKAFDPKAKLIKTCPGDPPIVTEEPFGAGYLLHILWHKNSYDDIQVVLEGTQEYDEGKLMDFMNLLPPGTPLPQVALDALSQTPSEGKSRRYTWKWNLRGVYGIGGR